MAVHCPVCGSDKVARVGRYDWFIKWSLGGAVVLGIAGLLAPIFWMLIPLWMLGVLYFYISRPLYVCEKCQHEWDSREKAPKKV
ncbi:MAG: hypothetical protein AB1776_05170 [Bacillota bacterium]